ncbi:hypothetical protein KI387_002447, partial [Taxus chinensis]
VADPGAMRAARWTDMSVLRAPHQPVVSLTIDDTEGQIAASPSHSSDNPIDIDSESEEFKGGRWRRRPRLRSMSQ